MTKIEMCKNYFDQLSELLKETYTVVNSCNKDASAYLVPIGKENEISYYGKPEHSFRVSDHWNWYSNLKKCKNRDEVQCWNVDVPYPRDRDYQYPNRATYPRTACQVAYYSGYDHKYHAIYGDAWDSKTKKFEWIESDINELIKAFI